MTQTTKDSDGRIQQAVVKRLDGAPDVRSAHIGVAVTEGAVTLSGEAASRDEKAAAIREATFVPGVAAVVDDLVVADRRHTVHDADVARSTQAMLAHHQQLRDQPIVATVHNHVVTLTGSVDRPEHKDTARRAALAVMGVRAVVNEIVVRQLPSVDAARVRIAEALIGSAASEISHLHVEAEGRVLVLRGNVHSWYERRAAERAARQVAGVTDVRNELVVVF